MLSVFSKILLHFTYFDTSTWIFKTRQKRASVSPGNIGGTPTYFASEILELDPRLQGWKTIEIRMAVRYTNTVRRKNEKFACTGN